MPKTTKNSITSVTQNQTKKRNRRGLLLAGAIGAVGMAAWQGGRRRFRAQINGTLMLEGLNAPVEIIRDRWGIPHIYAENTADLFFGQGFAQAQDRLWQMELNRRVAGGRLSEIFGEVTLKQDIILRKLGTYRAAHNDYAHASAEEKLVLDSYALGVNNFIAQHKLPLEFSILRYQPEVWSAIDCLAWAKMLAVGQSGNYETELVRAQLVQILGPEKAALLEPTFYAGQPLIVPPDADYAGIDFGELAAEYGKMQQTIGATAANGSNAWAIAGHKSTTGYPLLANDPHMAVTMPSTLWEVHLHSPEFDVIGAAAVGTPTVLIGHNRDIAWGVTNTMADFMDSFVEKLNPDNPDQYEYKGQWRDFETVQETIKIKSREPVTQIYQRSVHGLVMSAGVGGQGSGDGEKKAIAVSWTIYEPSSNTRASLAVNRASNWQEFRDALRDWTCPSLSFVYADTKGDIGWQYTGQMPIRGKGRGLLPSPGETDEYDWQGFIPYEELPHLHNPESGYIVASNQRPVDNDYPYHLGSDYLGAGRSARIREMLNSRDKFNSADFATMQADVHSAGGLKLARRLVRLDTTRLNETERRALAHLATWDGQLTANSVPGCISQVTLQKLLRIIFVPIIGVDNGRLIENYLGNSDGLGPLNSLQGIVASFLLGKLSDEDTSLLPESSTWDNVLEQALSEAVAWLNAKLGPKMEGWQWGKLHTLTYAHALGVIKPLDRIFNRGPYALPGDYDTVWQTGYSNRADNFTFNGATSAIRLIADLSDIDKTVMSSTSGQNGSPFSQHYADLIDEWLAVQHHPHLFSRADLTTHTKGKLNLRPKG